MRQLLILLFLSTFSISIFATIPPKKGVTPPPGFAEFQKMVSASYSEGYYAQKFRERKQLREDIANGLKSASLLEQDTTVALTLMGQYADLPAHYSAAQFQQHLFDGPNPTGTITDYYDEVSYSQLYFDGFCAGWYSVPGTIDYYISSSYDGPRFTLDLIEAADPTFNFAEHIQYYDQLNRPHIGFLSIIHTGAGAEAGAENIWSHRWNFTVLTNGEPYVTNDIDPVSKQNVLIDGNYAIEPELSGSSNTGGNIIEIGVFTHEFGHIFGLPDLYDTDGSSEGLGNWCLMAGGNWGGNGSSPELPVHMSAWCKKELGWLTPVNVTSYQESLSLPAAEENPVAYRMWTNGGGGLQYFLVENRQKTGFDINLYTSGFLIFHVDENMNNNQNENHYLVDLEQADGERDLNNGSGRGDAGDPFPGSTNNTSFDINTNPNSEDYLLQDTYISVRDIYSDGANMVGHFDVGTSPYIEVDSVFLTESVYQNGRVGPGEDGTLNFTLHNLMPAGSDNANVSFTTDESGIQINQASVTGAVGPVSVQTISIPEAISVDPDFISRTIKIDYTISYENNNTITDSFFVPIGIPEILIISRSDLESLGSYYINSLLELGRYYEESWFAAPEFYSDRKAIIVFAGRTRTDMFTQDEIDSLTQYINAGGKIFFSGQNIAEYLQTEYPDFLTNVIGINWVKNQFILTRDAYGISDDYFGNLFEHINFFGGDGAGYENNADVISAVNNFNISLTYKNDGTDPAGGYIQKPEGGKIFYLGFGFESINNDVSTISRNDIMDNILQWFEGSVGVASDNATEKLTYKLEQNYPNPFNPSTRIIYEVPQTELVTLRIYNIMGEEIATLLNEEKQAGRYTIEFDASDIASGVYLYKLSTGNYSSVRKMMVVK